jgi:hypothetical protein
VAVQLEDVDLTLPQGVPAEPLAHPNRPARPRRAPARPLDRFAQVDVGCPLGIAHHRGAPVASGTSAVIAAPSGTDVRKPSITPLLGPAGRTGIASTPGRGIAAGPGRARTTGHAAPGYGFRRATRC